MVWANMDNQPDLELNFARPPIVEAVIERRFPDPIDLSVIEDLRKKFEREYPAVDQLNEMSLAINPIGAAPQVSQNSVGYRLTNLAGNTIIVFTTHTIAFSRVAPYPGWHEFSAGAAEVFRISRGIMSYSTIGRIGVRYINRIDIPVEYNSGHPIPFRLEEYLLIYPEYPESVFGPVQGYTLQCITSLPNIASRATINVASAQSPAPRFGSIIFDIDIGRESDVPQREDEISDLLDSFRAEKNRIFADCLTAKAKALFQ
jgi:uncharacterized protein (TIGR04255 family)